jgi:hypothetical protein
MTVTWDPDFAERSPAFAPLAGAARELRGPAWPGCDDFNRILAACGTPVVNACGVPLRFVAQAPRTRTFEDKYEPRIFLRGEVQLRPGDWHDVFNALVWLTFPRAKAALNGRHFRALERQRANGARNRGPVQDALTLFDEGGVIVVTTDAALGGLLADHAWKELFWRRRGDVIEQMRFYLFGHGLYAKMLRPFPGVTARGVIVEVAGEFPALPLANQLAELDALLAARLAGPGRLKSTHELAAVPLLGIPGWFEESESEQFYDDTAYFRPPPNGVTAGRR